MRSVHFAAVVALLGALTACGPLDGSKGGRTEGADQGGLKTFRTQADAAAFIRTRLEQGDQTIILRLEGTGRDTAQRLTDAVSGNNGVAALNTKVVGGIVCMEAEYVDDALLLRAHRNPACEAGLTDTQRKALAKARQVVAEARRSGSDYECALALHDYLVKNTRYVMSPRTKDLTCCTTTVLLDGVGVCEGYTRAYNLLLTMAGIDNRYVAGRNGQVLHCWSLVKLDGQWTHVDCTSDDPMPDCPGRTLRAFFGMSDAQMAAICTWGRQAVPAAPSTGLYHPFKSGLHFSTAQQFVEYCTLHPLPGGVVTVYIDELGRPGADPAALLGAACARCGYRSGFNVVEIHSNPCAIGVRCAGGSGQARKR